MKSIEHAESQAQSPIIKGLSEIVTDPAFRRTPRKRLIVVSDMLENSRMGGIEINMYRGPVRFADIEKESIAAVNALRDSLADTQVQVLLVRNADSRRYHTQAHRKFWDDLFQYAGVSSETYRFERL